ncbi:hypothetical protein WICMUC_000348 [Wickerhamomyces mucosus]|uniref:Calcium-transporting ATPase n=1 Tax=Wickerhamomyces mucosus TaxID=1378264 RepID=A0A9P8PXM9_9ASCO|nr:hypothetical protein WICMUC_000348 [Wickerhamomyces mucosus]
MEAGLRNQSLNSYNENDTSTMNLSSFDISIDDLNTFHDPKSLLEFKKIFNDDSNQLFLKLKTDKTNGLNAALPDLQERTSKFGINKLPERKPKSFFRLAWEAMHDKVLILLSVAAIISLALGLYETFGEPPELDPEGHPLPRVAWVEGVAIIVAILVVVVVGAGNDYQKEKQFAKLNSKKSDREVIVLRGGDELLISIYDLLVGDILILQTGDVIPADSVMIQGSCECDESSITGESNSIHKIPIETALKTYNEKFPQLDKDIGSVKGVPDPFLISGSKLMSGVGKALVTSVGEHSIYGRTMLSLAVEPEETPLQARLDALATGITKYGILSALILFIVLFGRFLSNLTPGGLYYPLNPAQKGSKFLNILITAITIVVVAVPEGLPLAVTLALAFATTRMAKDANLVRVLRSCEIMSCATAVCSDKTGTLTENRMKVVNGNLYGLEFDDNNNEDGICSKDLELNKEAELNLLANIALNSTAFENKEGESIENPFQTPKRKNFWKDFIKSSNDFSESKYSPPEPEAFIGSKTETALLGLAKRSLGMDGDLELSKLRNKPDLLNIQEIVQVIPFESSRKWGGIVVKIAENHYRFYIKGAAELLLRKSSSISAKTGTSIDINQITGDSYDTLARKINSYAEASLRTITLAHKDYECSSWPPTNFGSGEADPEQLLGKDVSFPDNNYSGLTIDGIIGIKDPLRHGVKEAVAQCKRAGVTVRMVTGDNLTTAKAISYNCEILTDEDDEESYMEGPIFRKLSEKKRFQIVPNLRVLARSSPEDKRILVETLKKLGEVVAVTGDGTNDAPALKLADVGFSMGISGTEVAREASDIILMSDDFSAIVNAIKWGRCVSTSIKKFIQFQLTVNITACVLTFVSAVSSKTGESVLTAVQLLWVNLIMDTLAALALATDKPDNSILDKKPDGRNARLISISMWKMIIGQSMLQLIITLVLHFVGKKIFFGDIPISSFNESQLNALTFNTFVWLQFFKLWVTRKLDEADGITSIRDRISARNLNFFQHFFRNWYFLVIAGFIAGFQILIMFVGGISFSVKEQSGAMWATAIICGMVSLPWGVVIRIIPDEWVVAIFPTRVFYLIIDVLTLKFLFGRKNKHKDEEFELDDESDDEKIKLLYSNNSIFKKTKAEIEFIHSESAETFNPYHIYQKWRRGSFDSFESVENNHHALSALTMVPTIVGGAVAGWSPVLGDSHRGKKID